MSNIKVVVRTIGKDFELSNKYVWSLDIIKQNGIDTVPGLVIELSLNPDFEGTTIELNNNFWITLNTSIKRLLSNSNSENHSFYEAVLEWYSIPDLHGLSRRFEIQGFESQNNNELSSNKMSILNFKRFIERFSSKLHGYTPNEFSSIVRKYLREENRVRDWELSVESLQAIVNNYKDIYLKVFKTKFPTSFKNQIEYIILQIFSVWRNLMLMSPLYRHDNLLSICIRLNYNSNSTEILGCGVLFSNPFSQDNHWLFGHYSNSKLINLRAGLATLIPLSEAIKTDLGLARHLNKINNWINSSSNDPLQIYFIRTNNGVQVDDIRKVEFNANMLTSFLSRTSETFSEGKLRSILQLSSEHLDELLLPQIPDQDLVHLNLISTGFQVAPGACSGILCFDPNEAEELSREGKSVIFVSESPAPEFIKGILAAKGLVFATGGATSHVGIIARSLNKPCILGVTSLELSHELEEIHFGKNVLKKGDWATLDGTTGKIYAGHANINIPEIGNFPALDEVLTYCDKVAKMQVYANADTASEAKIAFSYGARGIGLCRIEHLLIRPHSLRSLQRSLILTFCVTQVSEKINRAKNNVRRWPSSQGALNTLAEAISIAEKDIMYQTYLRELESLKQILIDEITQILRCANGRPVVVRLLDPPLSEFLNNSIIHSIGSELSLDNDRINMLKKIVNRDNPMLGVRGIRLCHVAPELRSIQLSAILYSSKIIADERKKKIHIDIMAPFVIDANEITILREEIDFIAKKLLHQNQDYVQYRIGAMIETPRAALLAKEIAKVSDFLSIGTNDLAQFTWACSRDSAESDFLNTYYYSHLKGMPFVELDEEGVGRLISIVIEDVKKVKPGMSIQVCGEHASNSNAIKFFNDIGINYVSCIAIKVPYARLACGKASIQSGE